MRFVPIPLRIALFAFGLLAAFLLMGTTAQAQRTLQPGRSLDGALRAGDAVLAADGSYYDLYVVRARPGTAIEVLLTSMDFDAYLLGGDTKAEAMAGAYTDDDSGGETHAQLAVTVGASGEFWVLANTYSEGETGAYSISVFSDGGTPAGPGVIRAGDEVRGTLEPGDDMLPDESYVDVYTYEGSPGDRITVTLASSDFDAYLSGGRTENGAFVFETSDDDSGGGTDAQFTVEVGYSGRYTIRANSLRAGDTGAYTLRVDAEGGGLASANALRPGETASGTLTSASATLGDGSSYDFYEIAASPYESLVITMTSSAFDTYLLGGTTADGALAGEARDDDGGGGTDAMLRVQAGADGRYFVLANALRAGASGAYTLAVQGVAGGTTETGFPTLALGQTVTGDLSAADATMDDGTHFDLYVYEGTPGEEIEITLESEDFDTYLLLRRYFGGELENVAEDDDGGSGTNSRIRTRLDRSGTYVIGANTYTAGATGSYRLTLARPDDSAPDAGSELVMLRTGEPVTGVLEAGDTVLADTTFADLYVYRGNPGDRVAVTMRSSAFDAYLMVAAVNGENLEVIARDDDGAGGTDARIEFTVEGSGAYAVYANSYGARAVGDYSVLVERAASRPQTVSEETSRFLGKWSPATYEPSAAYATIRQNVQSERRLEDVVSALNESYPLPRNVPVSFEECGIVNAQYLYGGTNGRVRFCYELMDYLYDVLAPQVGEDRLSEAVDGAYEFIMLHEAGHALRHQLDLPITGREEDVADQFAALTLIRQGSKGARAAIDGVLALQTDGTFSQSDYAGEHSLGPQRLYNVVCLVYGSDPDKYAGLVGADGLPEARAVRCPAEYAQVEKAFDRLLGFVYNE